MGLYAFSDSAVTSERYRRRMGPRVAKINKYHIPILIPAEDQGKSGSDAGLGSLTCLDWVAWRG
jgi:hypothetical protein